MEETNTPDPDIVKLQANDNRSWEHAYQHLYQLGQMAIRLDGGQHAQNREDVILAAIKSVTKGVFEEKFNDWKHLRRSFLNTLQMRKKDFLRKLYRLEEDSYDPAELPETGEKEIDIESAAMTWDELSLLIALLDPPRRRQVFLWVFRDGLTTREVFEKHGIPRGTVTSDLQRGYETLRELITKQ